MLDSLLAQTGPDWECILVDDGSTDNTRQVAEEYCRRDARFGYVYQSNQGPNAARNTALRRCRGRYLQFLDADDLLEARKLEVHAQYLESHPGVDIVYGSSRAFTDEQPSLRLYNGFADGEDRPWMPEASGSGPEMVGHLVRANIMVNSAALTRMTLVERVGFTEEKLWQAEDWHFWLLCALRGAVFHFLDEPGTLALIRTHPASNSKDRWKMMVSELAMRKQVQRLIGDPALQKLNAQLIGQLVDFAFRSAWRDVKAGNAGEGKRKLDRLRRECRDVRFGLLASATRIPHAALRNAVFLTYAKGVPFVLKELWRAALHKPGTARPGMDG
jgi:glycosyltransferase involved in cell wall biosynthesis